MASLPDARVPIPLAEPGQRAGVTTRLPSSPVMRRIVLAALAAGALAIAAGCGGDGGGSSQDAISQVPTKGGLQDRVRAAQHVQASDFPSAAGKTLQQVAQEVKGGGKVEAGLASSVFTVGRSRFAFGMIDDQ